MGKWLLRGEVIDGQFDHEAIVSFNDVNGVEVSLIASRTLIRRDSNGKPSVEVRLLAEENGRRLVELPGEVFGAGRDVVVAGELLEPLDSRGDSERHLDPSRA